MRIETDMYIGGESVAARGAKRLVESPRTGLAIGEVTDASFADVDMAVAAARKALPAWAHTSIAERAEALERLSVILESEAEAFAAVIEAEQGSPAVLARKLHVDLAVEVLRGTAASLRELSFESHVANSTVRRQAIGVVAAITPWNFPLYQVLVKVAPALAAGCTVVLKPSELTPLTALDLARATDRAGFPQGVFNVVVGGGDIADQLARHRHIDLVSFTGSTVTGKIVAANAAADLRRVVLELGGKSPSIVMPDIDDDALTTAVKVTVGNCFLNAGQTCTALSRLLVPEDKIDSVVALLPSIVARYTPGDRLGPLISAGQRDRVLALMQQAIHQGATLLVGGPEADVPAEGYFVAPTVFTHVTPGMTIAQEEIFGPVLSVMTYSDLDEAIAIANGTAYGLTAAIWGRDAAVIESLADRLDAGQVDVNGPRFNTRAPFGGFKQSGIGRELGAEGILECTEVKSIQKG